MMGTIVSGGTLQQQFNANGERIGETITWTDKPSELHVHVQTGQAWIGGKAVSRTGETLETGGTLWAKQRIEVTGGLNVDGIGVKISSASQVTAVAPAATIFIDSAGDADMQGSIIAGGTVSRTYDANGEFLGRTVTTYDGDSEIRIEADRQIRFGRDLRAGLKIDLVGGLDPVVAGEAYSGNGILQTGSVQLSTWRPNSEINLNAPGRISILAPPHSQEIRAEKFIQTANGRLAQDVRLSLWVSQVDFDIAAVVTIPASATSSNTSIQDLLSDVQAALNAATWTVVRSETADHPAGSSWSADPADPVLVPQLSDSRILLTSAWRHRLNSASQRADLLGYGSIPAAGLESSSPYAIAASQPGSVVRIGAPAGPNGKLYIAGQVLAHTAIELYSGAMESGGNPDTVYVELEATGLLETVNGSISLSPGARTVLRGDVKAGGPTSDVTVNAAESIDLRGSLTAGRDILVHAGTDVVPGTASIRTFATSTLKTEHGGRIRLIGVNDVIINSAIGTDSGPVSQMEVISTSGSMVLGRTPAALTPAPS
jgi:hypothetical protein